MLFTYDTSGNVLTMTDPEGTLISFNYDDNGNVLSKTSTRTTPTGTETLTTINVYDHLGRIVENVDAEGNLSKVEYNAIGKQAAYIDKRNSRTEYFYDDLGNLKRADVCHRGTETQRKEEYTNNNLRERAFSSCLAVVFVVFFSTLSVSVPLWLSHDKPCMTSADRWTGRSMSAATKPATHTIQPVAIPKSGMH
jgi:YD repeat-containing protein